VHTLHAYIIYIRIYIHVRTYIHTYIQVYRHIQAHTGTYRHIQAHTGIQAHILHTVQVQCRYMYVPVLASSGGRPVVGAKARLEIFVRVIYRFTYR
jgi:hypothetical protein